MTKATVGLEAGERSKAVSTPVWIVWWKSPEKSWEAVCLSEGEAVQEYERRKEDTVQSTWGNVGKGERQTLFEWYEGHVEVENPADHERFLAVVREVLLKAAGHKPGPVVVKTIG